MSTSQAPTDVPVCPKCKTPFAPLPEQDRQALGLANAFPWVCSRCLLLYNGETEPMPLEEVLHQERIYYLALIEKQIRPIETRKELLETCDVLRKALATGSAVRWAWANVAPKLLPELWSVMDKIGVDVPPRPIALMDKPRVGEVDIQCVLQALSDVVQWCAASTDTATDERGRWLYEQRVKSQPTSWKNIITKLEGIAEERGWETLASEPAAATALKRWCKDNGKDYPRA